MQKEGYLFSLRHRYKGKIYPAEYRDEVSLTDRYQSKFSTLRAAYKTCPFSVAWHHIKHDKENFEKLITEISEVLNGEEPITSESCKLCLYRSRLVPR